MPETPKNPPAKPPAPEPVVEAAPIAPPPPPLPENKFLIGLSRFMTGTFLLIAGIAFILLGIYFKFKNPMPANVAFFVNQIIPHLPYFFTGIGLFLLGYARLLDNRKHSSELKKNRHYNHAWKIPLIGMQVFILQFAGIYCICAGFHWLPQLKSLMTFLFLILLFLGYLLWYTIAHFSNRFPNIAGLRVAMLALTLAALSFFSWVLAQLVFFSLLAGFFSVIAAVTSLVMSPFHKDEERGNWLRVLSLVATVGLLLWVGWNTMAFGNTRATLVNLGSALQSLNGYIDHPTYSKDGRKLAFSQYVDKKWYLQIIDPNDANNQSFKIPAGESSFRSYFVANGNFILMDGVKDGVRNLWKVDPKTGAVTILTSSGIEPLGEVNPWSESRKEFLYVTQDDTQYSLRVLAIEEPSAKPTKKMAKGKKAPKGKKKKKDPAILFSSTNPILTPSWTVDGEEVVYADGVSDKPLIYNLTTKKTKMLISYDEKAERVKKGADKESYSPAVEVFPSPDGFRYMYITKKGTETSIWTELADGSKASDLYDSSLEIKSFAWNPDGQKIVFEERERKLGFLAQTDCIKILDANIGETETLIMPQISHRSPAVSPDGVKIAFISSQYLWLPASSQSGIWVAVLR